MSEEKVKATKRAKAAARDRTDGPLEISEVVQQPRGAFPDTQGIYTIFPPTNMDVTILGSMQSYVGSFGEIIESPFTASLDGTRILKDKWAFKQTIDLGGFSSGDLEVIGSNKMAISAEYHDLPLENYSALIYVPVHEYGQPNFAINNNYSNKIDVRYTEAELDGIADIFGKIPVGTVKEVMETTFLDLARDSYQTLTAREVIPNVIINEPQELIVNDISFEGPANQFVEATTINTTTTY